MAQGRGGGVSTADWADAYWRDVTAPTPINGKSYVRGTKPQHGDVVAARRHIAVLKEPTEEQIKVVAQLHKGNQ